MSKGLLVRKDQRENIKKVKVNGEGMEEDMKFKYLGVMIKADWSTEVEVIYRFHDGRKILGTL